jgi:hypothetical protein
MKLSERLRTSVIRSATNDIIAEIEQLEQERDKYEAEAESALGEADDASNQFKYYIQEAEIWQKACSNLCCGPNCESWMQEEYIKAKQALEAQNE